ncbi:MAG: SEC-C metal-binding domain-containing protein, partial [Bacillota bacterium]|nr:SEC-C metal-binding domain-containing protein [Bacillota bacterium]
MNEKISRNDACPCGSGKKYKKCCGLKEVASITTIIEQEIEDLQHQLVSYALHHFGTELEEDFEDLIEAITISGEDEENFYLLTHTIWFSAFVPLEDGETILEKFIREEAKKTKRPKTKDILQSWTNGARTIAGKVLHSEANTFVFEDMLTGESQEGVIVTKVPDIEDGEFFTGILLPYEQRYVFFPIPYVLGHLNPQAYIVESAGNFGYESPQEFLNEHFMEMINELPAIGVSVQPDDLDWPAPIHKETAVLFKKMSEAAEEPADITEYGIMMWYHFCKATQKRIQNPAVYAAAIHYLAYNSTLDSQVTQKQIGERYGIAPNRISTISNDILDVLE